MLRFARMLSTACRAGAWAWNCSRRRRSSDAGWIRVLTLRWASGWPTWTNTCCSRWALRRRVRALPPGAVVHICDHSNAMYAPAAAQRRAPRAGDLPRSGRGARRAGRGRRIARRPRTGKILQRWIVRSLGARTWSPASRRRRATTCERLVRRPDGAAPDAARGAQRPERAVPPARPRRGGRASGGRSRAGLGHAVRAQRRVPACAAKTARACCGFSRGSGTAGRGRLVFAGEALPDELRETRRANSASRRAWSQVVKPSDAVLEALYNRALALLFPVARSRGSAGRWSRRRRAAARCCAATRVRWRRWRATARSCAAPRTRRRFAEELPAAGGRPGGARRNGSPKASQRRALHAPTRCSSITPQLYRRTRRCRTHRD